MKPAPDVQLPPPGRDDIHDGETWFLNLPGGRILRLVEQYDNEFTVERCDTLPPEKCPTCGGDGWCENYHGDGSVNRRWKCECQQ